MNVNSRGHNLDTKKVTTIFRNKTPTGPKNPGGYPPAAKPVGCSALLGSAGRKSM